MHVKKLRALYYNELQIYVNRNNIFFQDFNFDVVELAIL
jgi:hypothetical protein